MLISVLVATAMASGPTFPGPHAQQVFEFGAVERKVPVRSGPMPPPTRGPDHVVYGYQAYWDDDLNTLPWDELSHLAIFSANVTTSGDLYDTHRWDDTALAVQMADPYGVRIHLCVTNFNTSELRTLLGSPTARANLVRQLGEWQRSTGAHGINIDFEGMPDDARDNMVAFTRELEAEVGEVVLATPAIDWTGAWDYSELTKYADLFIMGYGYHWSGGSEAGPIDPLYSGSETTIWSSRYSLSWTVEDYRTSGADMDRVIMGLPLYGRQWQTANDQPPNAVIDHIGSITYRTAWAEVGTYGRRFDEGSRTPWYWDGSVQTWYGDTDSFRERVAYMVDEGLGGIGFWAMHYDGDDPAFWAMIHEETTDEVAPGDTGDTGLDVGPVVDGDFIADAGKAFLAYPGDTILLSGEGSRGPEGVDLEYTWVQVAGPTVALGDANTARPNFRAEQTGTHVFELTVGANGQVSAPARSHVVVLDRNAGRKHRNVGCGCSTGGLAGAWLLLPLLALLRRRGA